MGASAPPQSPSEARGALLRAIRGVDPQVWDAALASATLTAIFAILYERGTASLWVAVAA